MHDALPDGPPVLSTVADRVATVTLNRPAARNALSSGLLRALRTAMAEADADEAVDVIILTGADPAFCAGLDLKELGSPDGGIEVAGGGGPRTPWAPTAKPVIGAVNGVAVTGGFELALLCDFLVASERARFGDTHARVGVLPGWGLSVLLPQAVGLRRAVEMSMTGNFMDAEEALAFGLVNHVVPHDELLAFARRLAADIAGNDQDGVRTLLASYRAISRMTPGDGLAHETEVGRAFARRRFDPAAVAARREAIRARGRGQVGNR